MTAEGIARVVADIRAGYVRRFNGVHETLSELGGFAAVGGPVIDATAIYESLVAKATPVMVYEDHPCISPPWPNAVVAYQNEHGNVIAMVVAAQDFRADPDRSVEVMAEARRRASWQTAEPVDWDRVRWATTVLLYVGGEGVAGRFPTAGPVHLWRHAVYEDGAPADLFWAQLVDGYPMERWDMATRR